MNLELTHCLDAIGSVEHQLCSALMNLRVSTYMQSGLLPGMLLEVDLESCANSLDTHLYGDLV